MKMIETRSAAGHILAHDLTQIIPGAAKGARFKKGHIVTKEDIPVLLSMGKQHLFVWEQRNGFLHENEAAQRLAALCQNKDIVMSQVSEGKIELFASRDGLFQVDVKRLNIVNSIDNLIVATRHTNTAVRKGDKLAGVRVVPLVIEEKTIKQAERFIPKSTLLSLSPWKRKTCGLIITGSEVAQGLVRDAFAPALEEKLSGYGMRIAERCFPGDDQQAIAKAAVSYWKKGLDMVICTGGMSVDPDDKTPGAIQKTGASVVSYGAPVLPGAMFLLAYFDDGTPIVGLPGCTMYAKATVFDLVLPRLLCDELVRKRDLAALGHGGLCLGCATCSFPNCSFGKGG